VKKKTPSGTPSTDEEVLSELALDYPLPKILLESRQLAKLKGTYTDKLPKMVNATTGRVHTSYAQAVAVTGRLASSDPNLQNIPVRTAEGRRIRAAFRRPAGSHRLRRLFADRAAHHGAPVGRRAPARSLRAGEDVHRATAAEIFGVAPIEVGADQRRVAKVINFGLIYGMSAFGLARQLDLERGAAQSYIERYFARYPGVAATWKRRATRRRCRATSRPSSAAGCGCPKSARARPAAARAPSARRSTRRCRATAADLIKSAMIAVQGWLDAERCRRACCCRCMTNSSSKCRTTNCHACAANCRG
jgi:DNA polymerase-1